MIELNFKCKKCNEELIANFDTEELDKFVKFKIIEILNKAIEIVKNDDTRGHK